jgi:DNA-binding MarR family transcriptional regulator
VAAQPTTDVELLPSAGVLLALAGQEATRRLRDVLADHDLTPRQLRLLALLHRQGATGQRELGRTMGVDPSVLVAMLNPLESSRLVTRRRDPADRRRHVVTLTAAGERRLAAAERSQAEVEDALFSPLDDRARGQLQALLLALRGGFADAPGCDAD